MPVRLQIIQLVVPQTQAMLPAALVRATSEVRQVVAPLAQTQVATEVVLQAALVRATSAVRQVVAPLAQTQVAMEVVLPEAGAQVVALTTTTTI